MLPAAVVEAIEHLGPSDPEQPRLIQRLFDQLSAVLDPDQQLWDTCPHGSDCWRAAIRRPEQMHFRVPYVGPAYPSRRIVLVGMNSRDDGSVDAELRGMAQIVERFRNGQSDWGGQFHFRAATAVNIIAASQDRRPAVEHPTPAIVADTLLASARVQSVQCAPGPIDSRRSPTARMWRNCPELVMVRQLEILKPRVVALLGTETHRRLQQIEALATRWDSGWRESNNCFARGTIQLDKNRVPVFAMAHPAAGGRWQASIRKLIDSLHDEPLSS